MRGGGVRGRGGMTAAGSGCGRRTWQLSPSAACVGVQDA